MTATETVRRLHDDVLAARDHFGNDAAPLTLPPVGPVSQLLLLAGSQLSQAVELLQLAEQLTEVTNEEDATGMGTAPVSASVKALPRTSTAPAQTTAPVEGSLQCAK